jgi:hypothetical protein
MSCRVVNGSSQCQTGNHSAEMRATTTHVKFQTKSETTSARLEPPAMPWATIHSQAARPIPRSRRRKGRRGGGSAAAGG